jgi:hypothetical protein
MGGFTNTFENSPLFFVRGKGKEGKRSTIVIYSHFSIKIPRFLNPRIDTDQ